METTSLTTSTVSLTVAWLCLTTVTTATGSELRTLRYNISEEMEAGSIVGDFKRDYYYSADRGRQSPGHDLGDLRFAFRSPSKYFRIDSVTGVIRSTRRIDREQLCARPSASCDPYDQTLDVIVTPTQHFSLARVRVTVIDVNDNAPVFPVDEMTLDVWDNSPPGALFSVPYAEDPDGGAFGVRNYTLVGGQGIFELKVTDLLDGSHDVRIKLVSRLDRERQRTYNLTVIATDGGSPVRSGSLFVRVSVRGVAEVRPTFEKETFAARVEENSPTGRWVTTVQATTSGVGQPIVYSLVELPEVTDRRIPFRIDARTGSVYVSGPVDYERDREFRLTVAATSGGRPALSAHAQLVIEVVDVNDNAPEIAVNTLLKSGRGQVQENAPNGTFVAHVVVRDGDAGENSWTACLTNSAIFLLEELSASSEYKLTTAVTFDREDEIQHRVKVVCHDFGTPSLTSSVQLTIDVTDVNDNDPVFTRGSSSVVVSEGLAMASMLLRVSATDADDGLNSALTYALASSDTPPSEILVIDALTGEIRVTGVLDYETKTSYRFLVTATDSGDPRRSGSASLTLDLKDVNDEYPRFVEDVYSFTVVADRPPGSPVGRVQATDSDVSELHRNVSYSVDTLESTFEVDPLTGQLRTKEVLRQGQLFQFSVSASNSWSPIVQLSSSVNVSVLVNGTLPVFLFPNPSNSSVDLDPSVVNVGDVIAEVKVEHGHDVTLRYEIVYGSGDQERGFNIDERTGRIAVASDLENGHVYQLVLRVSDDLEPRNEVVTKLSVHVTEPSYGLRRLQTWLGSRERLMTIVGVVVGLALLVIVVTIGAVVSLRVRRRKTYRGEYNCRYEASRALKARSGDAGLVLVDDVNQAGVLLTSGKPRTPTKKKEVTFSLDDEGDDEEEDELYKGNQNIYSRVGNQSV